MKLIKLLKSLLFKLRVLFADEYKVAKIFADTYGIKMGIKVRFTGKKISFGSEPYLIEIGNNVTITSGVRFVTHDGGVAVFRKEYPGLNVFGKIVIGNNVFIGENAIILKDVVIGDNVVVGAHSVVTKSIPSDSVAAGVPARVIKSISEYKRSVLAKSVIIRETDPNKRKEEILAKIVFERTK